jgi:hypothetical protein
LADWTADEHTSAKKMLTANSLRIKFSLRIVA